MNNFCGVSKHKASHFPIRDLFFISNRIFWPGVKWLAWSLPEGGSADLTTHQQQQPQYGWNYLRARGEEARKETEAASNNMALAFCKAISLCLPSEEDPRSDTAYCLLAWMHWLVPFGSPSRQPSTKVPIAVLWRREGVEKQDWDKLHSCSFARSEFKFIHMAGEMSQQLKVLAALPYNLGLIPSNHRRPQLAAMLSEQKDLSITEDNSWFGWAPFKKRWNVR